MILSLKPTIALVGLGVLLVPLCATRWRNSDGLLRAGRETPYCFGLAFKVVVEEFVDQIANLLAYVSCRTCLSYRAE